MTWSWQQQLSLYELEHLLNLYEFGESPLFISEWPIKIYLYFVLFFPFNLVVVNRGATFKKQRIYTKICISGFFESQIICQFWVQIPVWQPAVGAERLLIPLNRFFCPSHLQISFTHLPAWLLAQSNIQADGPGRWQWAALMLYEWSVSQVALCSTKGEYKQRTQVRLWYWGPGSWNDSTDCCSQWEMRNERKYSQFESGQQGWGNEAEGQVLIKFVLLLVPAHGSAGQCCLRNMCGMETRMTIAEKHESFYHLPMRVERYGGWGQSEAKRTDGSSENVWELGSGAKKHKNHDGRSKCCYSGKKENSAIVP